MANIITSNVYGVTSNERILNKIKSSESEIYGLDFPIVSKKIDIYGKTHKKKIFARVTGTELLRNNLTQFIKTEKGNRVMRPDYGINLKQYLFNPLGYTSANLIANEVRFGIRKYLPNAQIMELSISEDDSSKDSAVATLNLNMTVRDALIEKDIVDIGIQIK